MIELGKIQNLIIKRITSSGAFIGSNGEDESVLLPGKYIPEGADVGDEVSVFIYRDSNDRMIATTLHPLLIPGETGMLKVKENSKIGAFLDWGLEKDLLLPFREQTCSPEPDREYLVAVYLDKSDRFCATMNVYDYLRSDSSYRKNDKVTGTVYQINERFGAFVAVDNTYHGLIPKHNLHGNIHVGDKLELRVVQKREDGKLELSTGAVIQDQIDVDAEKIYKLIESYDGVLPFTEKASPEVIERELGMSKAAFKRGVGRLFRDERISLAGGKIRII